MNFSLPTNNEAEYEALLHGMKMAKACGATRLEIYGDSNLVVQQSMNLCDVVSDNMIAYRQLYQNMEAKFEGCELKHIGRASNEEADTLANIGSMCSPIPDGVFYEVITQRSIKEKASVPPKPSADESEANPQQAVEESPPRPAEQVLLLEPLWTKPFLTYLTKQELPEDPVEARRIVRRSKAFTVVNGELYKRNISFKGVLPLTMEKRCCVRYTRELADTTQEAGPLWQKPSGQDFTGQRRHRMLEIWL
jgi:hypothetical protein